VPAPAVIPALVAYINTVVVKTLVVDLRAIGLNSVLARSYAAPCYNGVVGRVAGILGICPHGIDCGSSGVGSYLWSDPCQRFAVGKGLMVQL
jgi:hypothetical protein